MNITGCLILVGVGVGTIMTAWGLFAKQRSVIVGLIAAAVAVLALGGVWYAVLESQSIVWTAGYGFIAGLSAVAAVRQFLPRGRAAA